MKLPKVDSSLLLSKCRRQSVCFYIAHVLCHCTKLSQIQYQSRHSAPLGSLDRPCLCCQAPARWYSCMTSTLRLWRTKAVVCSVTCEQLYLPLLPLKFVGHGQIKVSPIRQEKNTSIDHINNSFFHVFSCVGHTNFAFLFNYQLFCLKCANIKFCEWAFFFN